MVLCVSQVFVAILIQNSLFFVVAKYHLFKTIFSVVSVSGGASIGTFAGAGVDTCGDTSYAALLGCLAIAQRSAAELNSG